jgi:hypothetical protein
MLKKSHRDFKWTAWGKLFVIQQALCKMDGNIVYFPQRTLLHRTQAYCKQWKGKE